MALPTASDNQFPKVILEEVASDGSATVTPAADHRALFLGEDGVLHLKDSAAAVTDVGDGGSGGGTYADWTPTLTATTTNPTLGSGSEATGRYTTVGNMVHATARIGFGTSGVNAGSGTYIVSLPTAMRTPVANEYGIIGTGMIYDSSGTTSRHVVVLRYNDTSVIIRADGAATNSVSNSSPWTWAASDSISLNLAYEKA